MAKRRKKPSGRKRLPTKQLLLLKERKAAMAIGRQDLVQSIVRYFFLMSECCEQVEQRLDSVETYLSDATPDGLWAWGKSLANEVQLIKNQLGMGGGTVPPPPKFP